jgi:glycosyltransferase involved in cell wall biosynthesis
LDVLTSDLFIQDGVPYHFNETPQDSAYLKTESARIRFCRHAISYSLKIGARVCHFLYLDHFIISASLSGILQNKALSVCATLHAPYFLPDFALTSAHKLKGGIDLIALRFLTSRGLRVMVHSEKSASSFNNKFSRAQQFDYVPYPIKTHNITDAEKTDLRARLRARLGLASQDVLLLVFGATRRDKGADIAIKMLSHLPRQCHLLFAGEDTFFSRTYLADLASDNGVRGRVHFDNRFIPEDEIPTYFCGCDIVLIPYRKNFAGQSGPLTIAASFGTKVVAPNLPVLAETVLKNDLGYLYPVENVELMADAVQKAINASVLKYSVKFIHEHCALTFTNAVSASYWKSLFGHKQSLDGR